jgi:hypothetical protein
MTGSFLLIGGCPRSGTTALLQLLNSDPHVFISSEENVFKSMPALESLLDSRGRLARKMQGQMRELSPRETLTMDNIHSYNMDVSAVWPTLRFIYEHHHQQIHPGLSLKVWGDKLPAYARDIQKVLSLPDGRYLHITRNPYDVVNSMLRRTQAARQGKDWWKSITEFDEMVDVWAESYRAIEKFGDQHNVLHLHYEQLVFDFQQSSQQICHFLKSDLHFENLLVDNPDLHFDRSLLTADMVFRISEHPAVADYVRRYARTSEAPQVAHSLSILAQAGRWARTAEATDVNNKPGMSSDAIKVFVGCTPGEWLPMRVLEYTIRSATTRHVDLVPLYTKSRSIPTPAALTNRPRTPFSFQRFLIPELCGYRARAIYLDADMQVFADMSQLWGQDFNGHDLLTTAAAHDGRKGQFSVMLLDCAALKWKVEDIVADLDSGKLDYSALMYDMCVARSIGSLLPPEWNSLERYEPGKTCLLHYTDMNRQPWVDCSNPLAHLWVAGLRQAMINGFLSREELQAEVDKGHVRPSLLEQIDSGFDCPLQLTKWQKDLDHGFVAPYRRLQTERSSSWVSLFSSIQSRIAKIPHTFKFNRFHK